jgi:NTE family protein
MAKVSIDYYLNDPEVVACLDDLKKEYGDKGENLVVSDVLDADGHQYVHLVQKGGGVLGVALIGYTYILEQMNIRFIRLAGTSAGAINTALMTVIGGGVSTEIVNDKPQRTVAGDKKKAKSPEILKALCDLDFFDLVDGHPAAKRLIKSFISNEAFTGQLSRWIKTILGALVGLLLLDFVFAGLQHKWAFAAVLSKIFFIASGVLVLVIVVLIIYFLYLFKRLKTAGFGINPGDFFYNWIKDRLKENDVISVSDLISKSTTPVKDLKLRVDNPEKTNGLNGDVTFITSELVSQNKIEFPRMANLFRENIDDLQPAGFVRASMSIPVFFESYFINDIPSHEVSIKREWAILGEMDPPSTARFVDGGILSNFPINLFYNPNVDTPRLPSFGIDLDDSLSPEDVFAKAKTVEEPEAEDDAGKDAEKWSLGGYLYRLFNTVRFYYDKDFLIKNAFFKKGIGSIPLKGFNWLNFFMEDEKKKQMFILGARTAAKFLREFNWQEYKVARTRMQADLKNK